MKGSIGLTAFFIWNPKMKMWKFREWVSTRDYFIETYIPFSTKAMDRRKRRYKHHAKLFMRVPPSIFDMIEGRKIEYKVCTLFYKLQLEERLPVPRFVNEDNRLCS